MFKICCLCVLPFFFSLLTGCADLNTQAMPGDPYYAPVIENKAETKPLSVGSIYHTRPGINLYDDRRAYEVGDIITVLLDERTVSSKSAETKIDKNSDVSIGDDTVLGRLVDFKGHSMITSVDQQRGFDGTAEADQENRLQGSIAVTVTDVTANGLLVIRGEKWMTLTHGKEFIRVSGLIRPEDVSFNNSVSSMKVADARISYSGTGDLAASNKPGWMTRFFNSPLWPF